MRTRLLLPAILFFCLAVSAEETDRERLFNVFNSVDWADNEVVENRQLAMPYRLYENDGLAFGYSEFLTGESSFPFLEGIGVLDYSGVDRVVLNFFISVGRGIKAKNIDAGLCSSKRSFLPDLIAFLLNEKPAFKDVFFSIPEFFAGNVSCKFRVNVNSSSSEYFLLAVTGKLEDGKWVIWEFEVVEDVALENTDE
ncbi:MAG: hypothetical protein CR988_07550 [Treponema sp.]|nr:MAG: hypothetical protein CR988_07550 [Treponema sp.]